MSPPVEPGASPAAPSDDDHPSLVSANARAGLGLFALYLALYLGFVVLSAFAPTLMAWRPVAGLNFAVLYGMGLIGGAVVLSLVYMVVCRRIAGRHASGGGRP